MVLLLQQTSIPNMPAFPFTYISGGLLILVLGLTFEEHSKGLALQVLCHHPHAGSIGCDCKMDCSITIRHVMGVCGGVYVCVLCVCVCVCVYPMAKF